MWYVIQTIGGREQHALNLIAKLVDTVVIQELFIPRCEIMKRIGGVWVKRADVMLPGYVFVVTDDPAKLESELRKNVPLFTKILRNNDTFAPLDKEEIAFINAFAKPGTRVVELSIGVIEGDKVVILNGPLLGQTGHIKKIDRHKRLAYLNMTIMGRQKAIKLGLEIVRKQT
ncbi:antiterminator LoaP [Adlercreutzia sp. ZJ141]|uniref:antiterminator LoaP n=1 Tax=Adlercreutzia sp. ZJ141 TaxID=2709406 RepID=UPI0013ECE5BC|nr:antiterminator LoaP [Adlercreutzia sp. ZJ141]